MKYSLTSVSARSYSVRSLTPTTRAHLKLIRTIGNTTTEYLLRPRVILPKVVLRDGTVIRSREVDVEYIPRRWLFNPTHSDGSPSALCGSGIAEIK